MQRQVRIPSMGIRGTNWGFKGTGHVRHGSAYYQYSGTDQREGHQRADACHLSGQPCGYKSCQQAHKYHEEQVAACRSTELSLICEKKGGSSPSWLMLRNTRLCPSSVTMMTEQYPEQNGQHDGTVQPGIVRLDDTCSISLPHVLYGYGNGSNALLSAEGGVVCHPVMTWAKPYRARCIPARETRMPIGMFRFGFFVSWAAVLTASNRGKAKNTMAALAGCRRSHIRPARPYWQGCKVYSCRY